RRFCYRGARSTRSPPQQQHRTKQVSTAMSAAPMMASSSSNNSNSEQDILVHLEAVLSQWFIIAFASQHSSYSSTPSISTHYTHPIQHTDTLSYAHSYHMHLHSS
ncbi:hypothetical protein A4X03_0g5738, partial [Tilletia caries]